MAKDLKPLTEKFDKEIEEISKLREDVNKQVIPYGEQVQRLTLPGPSGEAAPKMIADMNKGFTQEELAFIQNQQFTSWHFFTNPKGTKLCETNIR